MGSDSEAEKSSQKVKEKKLLLALAPIAKPLAGKKLSKRIFKLVRRGHKCLKRGVKEVVKSIRRGNKGLCVIAGNISPIDVITHVPILCEESDIPYIYVTSKEDLANAGATKRPTCCVLVLTKPAKGELAQEEQEKLKAEYDQVASDAWQCSSGKEVAWNLLSLFTTAVMLSLEISLMAFLIQENYSTGFESLARAFTLSGVIVGVDMLLKAIFVFGFSVPLFFDGEETTHRMKWGLWTINKLLLAAVYGFILFVHSSKWQDKLPPRPMFYNYVVAMFVTNAVALFAYTLSGIGFTFGPWLYNLTLFCYHSLYLPFLYITFSADIFQEEDLLLDNAYYSEMKDAGFFDVDWD
ncbi:hypothetical protein Vadar_024158 [Vaccinium darrowii]|uniref:Uncharacterized protein n=1 Tax=Vaccinium darrowii TaxID=229202 RepID=A0ACB7YGZ2_9ERIC|nr:hypothetical protein Vadar_024158 [Vaccinium darrowii]